MRAPTVRRTPPKRTLPSTAEQAQEIAKERKKYRNCSPCPRRRFSRRGVGGVGGVESLVADDQTAPAFAAITLTS